MRVSSTKNVVSALATGVVAAPAVAGTVYSVPGDVPTLDAALTLAKAGDTVVVASSVFANASVVDFQGKAVTLRSTGSLVNQFETGVVVLADGGALMTADARGDFFMSGELQLPASAGSRVNASGNEVYVDTLRLSSGASLNLTRDGSRYAGSTFRSVTLQDGAAMTANVVTLEDATLVMGAQLLVDELYTSGVVRATNASVSVYAATGVGPQGESLSVGCCGAAGVSSWTLEQSDLFAAGGAYFGAGAVLSVYDSEFFVTGDATFDSGSELTARNTTLSVANLVVRNGAVVDVARTELSAKAVANEGVLTGSGEWLFETLVNATGGTMLLKSDTLMGGDVENDGAMALHAGVVTVAGSLDNQGELFADANGRLVGGFAVAGDLTLGEDATLSLPGEALTLDVRGSFFCEVDDTTRLDLELASLTVGGNEDATFEVMGMDLGADMLGFDRELEGNVPVGSLTVRGELDLVNEFYNSGAGTEALYVDTLVVSEDATLNTNGLVVYYRELVLDGDVDNPMNLVPVSDACPGDCNGNGMVDFNDLAAMLFEMGTVSGVACDADRSGLVDFNDMLTALFSFGSCN